MRVVIASAVLAVSISLCAPLAGAAPHEARIPLRDGRLDLGDLSVALCREFHLREHTLGVGGVSLDGIRGSRLVAAMNESLGDGCRVTVTDGSLVLHLDPQKLPRNCQGMSKAVRVFTATAARNATAAQAASYGLRLPEHYDRARPLVVLVHGLDCDRVNWGGMAQCLIGAGYQCAFFTYPSDQPIAESAAFFAGKMRELRQAFPAAEVNVLAYSMGGLVSRCYIEGPDYAGGVRRLIMVGTPNAGSGWARFRMVLELQEHYQLWRHEPKWSPTWMITDGLGEAGRDLKPGSKFLSELNSRPRREGVKYSIICGDQNPADRIGADLLDSAADSIPHRISNWWGFRQCRQGLTHEANQVRNAPCKSDGPVALARAKLPGVDDVVIVHADHARLYLAAGAEPPAAWDTIRDRLEH